MVVGNICFEIKGRRQELREKQIVLKETGMVIQRVVLQFSLIQCSYKLGGMPLIVGNMCVPYSDRSVRKALK